ncbi:MAG: hypothetical protein JWQ07_4518 [Ramlibacter sp.]|nr:hypothetical protein [Ramlibacter sp.]
MNLQQLRYFCGVADQGLNLSKAAEVLHTSQPGISRQLRQLEEELGTELLVRQGNRIAALTEPGRAALEIARRVLRDIDNLRSVGADHADEETGTLVVATTHLHARYILIPIVHLFHERYPGVNLTLRQGTPDQIAHFVNTGAADLGIATIPTTDMPALARLPYALFRRGVLVPKRHPLLHKKQITLADVAHYPMISLDRSYASGVSVMNAFEKKGIKPNIVVTATDADVTKAYVAAGLGIATLPEAAYDAKEDASLKLINARHLFPAIMCYIWVHRHLYLRGYASEFIRMLSPAWTRPMIDRYMRSEDEADPGLALDPPAVFDRK